MRQGEGWRSQLLLCLAPGLACSNDLLNFDTGDVNLFGEFPDGFVGVLVGEGVNVDLHPRGDCNGRGIITRRDATRVTDAETAWPAVSPSLPVPG